MFLATGALDDASARCQYLDGFGSNANPQHTWTFNNRNGGKGSSAKTLLFLIDSTNADASLVGGLTYLRVQGQDCINVYPDTSGFARQRSVWALPFPGGTVGDQVTVEANRATGNGFEAIYITMWAGYFLNSVVPIDVQLASTPAASSDTFTITQAGGFLIDMSEVAAGFAVTWAGATQAGNDFITGVTDIIQVSAAIKAPTPASTGYQVTTSSAATFGNGQFAASFR